MEALLGVLLPCCNHSLTLGTKWDVSHQTCTNGVVPGDALYTEHIRKVKIHIQMVYQRYTVCISPPEAVQ
jgi:hypothetical protein